MQDMLHGEAKNAHLIMVQEPYIDFLGRTRALPHLRVIYPLHHLDRWKTKTSRSIILVNSCLPTDSWTSLDIDHPDITAVQIVGSFGTFRAFSIYNDNNNDGAIQAMARWLQSPEARSVPRRPMTMGWFGDFNRHHPMWEDPKNVQLATPQYTSAAQPLINLLSIHDMKMALPEYVPTLRSFSSGTYTRPDNVFCSRSLLEQVIRCEVDHAARPIKTDHYPVFTMLNVETKMADMRERRNWRQVNWEDFRKRLTERLEGEYEPKEIQTETEFWEKLTRLDLIIDETIQEKVPVTKPSPQQRRWWNKDLQQMRKLRNNLGKKSYRKRLDPQHPVHEELRRIRQSFSAEVKRAKAKKWMEYLETATSSTMWDVGRLVEGGPTDGARSRIPELVAKRPDGSDRRINTNEEKADLFREIFFPPMPTVSNVPPDAVYPPPAWKFQPPSNRALMGAVQKMKNGKATRPGTIPNDLFKACKEELVPYLGPIYRATFALPIYPEEWAANETIVLRKPGKPDYQKVGAWRPVVLSNGHGRLNNGAMVAEVIRGVELLGLLPPKQFGARPGRATTDSIHLMTDRIKDLWKQGYIVSALYMDVKGAFPSVDLDMLYHELRMVGVPIEIVDWMKRRYKKRTTRISFDDFMSEPFEVAGGEDQGDPAAALGYILYAAGLLQRFRKEEQEEGYGFMDDVAAIKWGKEVEKIHEGLGDMMRRDGGILEWAREHNCTFGVDKFTLVDFTRKRINNAGGATKTMRLQGQGVRIGDIKVEPVKAARFLGVMMDSELRWKEQHALMVKRGQGWLVQFRRLARMKDGMVASHIRQFYKSKAIPRMLYAADVVMAPQVRNQARTPAVTRQLATIQRQAARIISGAMATTASDILDIHAALLPMDLEIERHRQRAGTRLTTLPETHPIAERMKKAVRNPRRSKHISPLHNLLHMYGLKPRQMEKRQPVRFEANWDPELIVDVCESKEEALRTLEEDNSEVQVFTDGSGYKGHVGAAAVLFRGGRERGVLRYRLGNEDDHEVYEGECVGMVMGLHLACQEPSLTRLSIWADNTAAITAANSSHPGPSHYILDHFHSELVRLRARHPGVKVRVSWVPGHMEVEGNERADEEAKRAAMGRSSRRRRLPEGLRKGLPRSRTSAVRVFRRDLERRHDERWRRSPRYDRFRDIDPSPATKASREYWKLSRHLPRRLVSILTQLRTGHIPLYSHLHKIKCIETPICPCCERHVETVHHYLFQCIAHRNARDRLRSKVGRANMKARKLLTNASLLVYLFKFVNETRRFRHIVGDLPELQEEEQDE
ncbi:hypothetical protein D9757_003364 [Collybiopsis confluens]|uniref:RNase H type-1 domain-containing protein n=1 Tax=Collybiopsis confluens TaxID=2823264 RepID=A0A8H5MFN2_9AGAR|nr:hypothetical protein D9757_003364 [Collybiopsis confluens]